MITALIAAAIAAPAPALPAAGTAVPNARPALYVVNDEDTIIYLFGTFHALDGKSEWFNDEVRTAFTASNELILETLVPAQLLKPIIQRPVPPMPVQPVGPFAGSASFLSTNKMVMSAGQSQGMSTKHGADAILRDAAEEVGKPVGGLESFEFQLGMFSQDARRDPPSDPAEAARTKAARSRDAHTGCRPPGTAATSKASRRCSSRCRPSRRRPIGCSSTTVTVAGRSGSRAACSSLASCSSPSAQAISPARTASSKAGPVRHPHRPGRTDAAVTCADGAPPL